MGDIGFQERPLMIAYITDAEIEFVQSVFNSLNGKVRLVFSNELARLSTSNDRPWIKKQGERIASSEVIATSVNEEMQRLNIFFDYILDRFALYYCDKSKLNSRAMTMQYLLSNESLRRAAYDDDRRTRFLKSIELDQISVYHVGLNAFSAYWIKH